MGLKISGHEALAIACDVSDEDQVAAMIDQSVRTFGRLVVGEITRAGHGLS